MCAQPRFYNVEINDFDNFKGLIVTDFHLGQTINLENDRKALIKNLERLVLQENPTHLFILGDIIHYSFQRVNEWYFDFFKMLENSFSFPIYIIPGNHDYEIFPDEGNCFSLYANEKNVKCLDVEFLVIKYSDSFSLFLGHDVSYNRSVHTKKPIIDWMNEIRHWRSCKDKIKDTDVLIFGHTHEDIDDEETNNYTIAPFSLDLKQSSYGIISFKNGFKFEHMTNFKLNYL